MDSAVKIVKKEIDRLRRAYNDAQDRYAYTGSRSTDNTMYKYSVLKDALEKSLADPSEEEQRLRRLYDGLHERITNAEREIKRLRDERELLPGYADKLIMILEGKTK
jgi:wobble nucleotide-excising tRNase